MGSTASTPSMTPKEQVLKEQPKEQPKRAARAFSLPSEEAVQALQGAGLELQDLEQIVQDVLTQFQNGSLTAGQARTALASVEARGQKLEAEGIDNVYTGELNSGKAQAKTEKKELLTRLEELFCRLEAAFQLIKDAEAGVAA